MSIRRIRRAIREGRYEFTLHALEEMDEDDITEADVAQVVIAGSLVATLTDDPRELASWYVERRRIRTSTLKLSAVSYRPL